SDLLYWYVLIIYYMCSYITISRNLNFRFSVTSTRLWILITWFLSHPVAPILYNIKTHSTDGQSDRLITYWSQVRILQGPPFVEEYPSLAEGVGLENRKGCQSPRGFESLFLLHLDHHTYSIQLITFITRAR